MWSNSAKDGRPIEPDGRLDAPAFHRNHQPIWAVLQRFLAGRSGDVWRPAQRHRPACRPVRAPEAQTSPGGRAIFNEQHLKSINAWRAHAQLANVRPPWRDVDHMAADTAKQIYRPLLHVAPPGGSDRSIRAVAGEHSQAARGAPRIDALQMLFVEIARPPGDVWALARELDDMLAGAAAGLQDVPGSAARNLCSTAQIG